MATSAQCDHFDEETDLKVTVTPPEAPSNDCLQAEDPTVDPDSTSTSNSVTAQIVRSKVRSKQLSPSRNKEPEDVEDAKLLPQIFISNKTYTYDERVDLFCDQMIGQCSVNK